jgi:tRNA pseudouridine55 synthase
VRSGLLVINKPAGISSRECVNRVQRAAHDRRLKVGHAGTLDPLATGVLLIAIGEATRLVEQLHELDKCYVAQFQFGKSSDTLDRDGEIEVHENLSAPNRLELDAACQRWVGPAIAQRPPRYSAIKIQGQRAYDLARRGQEFDPEARPVAIHALQVLSFAYPDWSLDIHCGSGTYVRSIGRDVAADLHNVAIMTELVRTAIGPFTIQDACPLDDLRQPNDIESRLCSPLAGLPNWHQALVTNSQIEALRHGQKITLHVNQLVEPPADQPWPADRWVAVDDHGQLIALLDVSPNGYTRPSRVFQTTMATSQPMATMAKHNPES